MTRLTAVAAIALVGALSGADAFTAINAPRTQTFVSTRSAPLFMSDEDDIPAASGSSVERGVSVDQDGKSNVWAIEPKMEVEIKSSEEKTSSAIAAVAGFAAFAAVAAGLLSNLPDPDTF
uniref:Transmembrane protein n=1 Tax=Ditylum brightwellii TaxID=49249 RepID=A0A6U4ABU4_9STRA|mmetsp:Transcript_32806/g.48858  ORF Transcript_32806/g.48858 Transcript_32806/m.48858 type:complete len:120 (+) Transcript_32806:268-627(+)